MIDINLYIFQRINSLAGKNKWLDAFGRAGGEWVIFGMLGWFFVISWLAMRANLQVSIRSIGILMISSLLGWVLNWLLALFIHEPRPFVKDPNNNTMFHPLFPSLFKWKSFPSDHTMFAFTIFFTALVLHLPLVWPLFVLALWVGWGRIYAGVHYPGDIVGGFAVAMFVGSVANYVINILRVF
ncbi:MAG: phosphatase PAP2 family protein [Candidatus Magasanikbacteria bacterium]|jgi:undecaprenyl-diphosphatase